MTRQTHVASRLLRVVSLCAAVSAAALSCGDFAATNPYDPAVSVQVTVLGPDTLFSYREVASFGAQTVPQFPDSAVVFATSDSIAFFPSGRGLFSSMAPPLYPLTKTVYVYALIGQIDTVSATTALPPATIDPNPPPDFVPLPPPPVPAVPTHAWRHGGFKHVVLTQRVVRIQLRCPNAHACDPVSAGSGLTVWADGLDALGSAVISLNGINANPGVSDTTPSFATFTVRDTTVASVTPVGIRVANVTALKAGTTWIVASRQTLLDSLQIIVR